MVYIYSNLLKQKTKELIAHGRAVMSVTKYEPANLLQALNLQQAHHAVITTFFCRHTQGGAQAKIWYAGTRCCFSTFHA